jgi:hypothetical protein
MKLYQLAFFLLTALAVFITLTILGFAGKTLLFLLRLPLKIVHFCLRIQPVGF